MTMTALKAEPHRGCALRAEAPLGCRLICLLSLRDFSQIVLNNPIQFSTSTDQIARNCL